MKLINNTEREKKRGTNKRRKEIEQTTIYHLLTDGSSDECQIKRMVMNIVTTIFFSKYDILRIYFFASFITVHCDVN
jgi:hypothetical protein